MPVPKHFNKFDRNPGLKDKAEYSPTEEVASIIFGRGPNGRENSTQPFSKTWDKRNARGLNLESEERRKPGSQAMPDR